MKILGRAQAGWLIAVLCAACNDSPAQATGSGSTSSGETTGNTTVTSSQPTTADTTSMTDGTTESGSTAGTSSSGPTSADASTTSDDESSSSEPPHVTDFGLCEIAVTCDQTIVDEPKRSCNVTVTEADGYVVYDGAGGLENRGRSSQTWPKHQYGLELWQHENTELIAPGSTWRYNATASPGGADWMSLGFDDSGWSQGAAPLGWGILGPEQWATVAQIANVTTIGFGGDPDNKHITSWYRQEFEIADAATLDPVELHLRVDDGAIAYINGVEVARWNLPTGPITTSTLALRPLDYLEEIEFTRFRVPAEVFVDGTNVLAVAVHQGSVLTSDSTMDVTLSTDPPGVSTNFFEFGGASDWILNGMYFDLSLYRNKLMYDLFTAFDPLANYGAQSHYCELTLDGDWRGIYVLSEQIERDDDRVNIFPELGNGESFIFKSDVTQTWIVTNGIAWQLIYPDIADLTPSVTAGLTAYMSTFAAATAGNGNIWDYVDMTRMVDWVLLQELSNNGDAYYSSMHIYKDVGGKIVFVPWDFDIGLGGSCNSTEDWLPRWDGHWLNVMTGDPAFRAAFVARWMELREGVLSQDSIDAQLAGYVETMTPEKIAQNFERWPMDQIIGGDDWVLPFREGCPAASWDEEHMLVQGWLSARMAWMDANIASFQ